MDDNNQNNQSDTLKKEEIDDLEANMSVSLEKEEIKSDQINLDNGYNYSFDEQNKNDTIHYDSNNMLTDEELPKTNYLH